VETIPVTDRDTARPSWRNSDLPLEARVDDLVSRMTLEEKVSQMLYGAPAIDRLGIPAYNWWNEALHGVARAGKATVFPQAIGLAATFDAGLIRRAATVISDEARAKHHEAVRHGRRGIYEGLTFWSPNINIFRDPRWGRGMETYGEDPYLTGQLGVEFVRGMQGDDPHYLKTVSTPKHFAVHSGPEPERHVFDAQVDERDLRETYLPAFRATVIDAHAQSVMCAYNRFRGDPCCGSSTLLQRILRDEWGFDGYVVSDCWAIMDFYTNHKVVHTAPEAAAMALEAGTDLNCGVTYDSLTVAVRRGLVNEDLVTRSVKRLFRARFQLGMFDPPERVAYARIPPSVIDSKPHRALALDAARESIVLLKNEDRILPLKKDLGTIAVIGPNADEVELLLGNYNGTPSAPVTPLEGIRKGVSSRTRVLYARGCDVAEGLPSLEAVPASALSHQENGVRAPGLKAEYFGNNGFVGAPVRTRVDRSVDFNWWEGAPLKGMRADSFSVRWSGILTVPSPGRCALGIRVFGDVRVFLNDSLALQASDLHNVSTAWKWVTPGGPIPLRIEYRDLRAIASVQLVWTPPDPDLLQKALEAARRADAVVMVLGLSPRLEGEEMEVKVPGFEGGDRLDLEIPRPQNELLRHVAATGKPLVVVLLNGSAVAVNDAARSAGAIVEAWYPGQAGGTAIADVLFGNTSPAGRLPVTFYQSVDQLPPFRDYAMKGRTYRYFTGTPLFPFGHGLSYTMFRYDHLQLPARVKAGEPVTVTATVTNAGKRAGDEVVQLYLTARNASVPVPIRALEGFRRITLKAGEKQSVSFVVQPRQLSVLDRTMKRVIEPGVFGVSVGGKQPGFSGLADASTTEVVSGTFEVEGTMSLGEGR
jgi:beta-glucosidase